MDTTTNKGMEPSALALKISQAVLNGDEDLVISPFYHEICSFLSPSQKRPTGTFVLPIDLHALHITFS